MSVSLIPTSVTLAHYVFTTDLDGVSYQMSFKFNERDDAWYLTILDIDDNVLRGSIKIVNEWPILRLWQEDNAPSGQLLAVNQGDVPAPPTLKQLGEEVLLTYLDAESVAAIV